MKKEFYRYRPTGLTERLTDSFGIEIYFSTDKLSAIFYAGKSSKCWWHYRFSTLEDMLKRIYTSVDNHIQREQEKIEKIEAQRTAMKNFQASDWFKIGDIIVNSWGYDQTNVDFYQVTEVLNKKIRVREISSEIVEATGSMSAYVMPVKDSFCHDTEISLLSLKADINSKGEISCRICDPKSYYHFHKWSGTKEYCSWYA
jgi:hypothetical protein